MYRSVRSETSFKLYIAAAVLLFIQAGLVFGFMPNPTAGFLTLVIGVLFIVGAAMAKIGFGIAARTERSVGGGYVVSSVETADAIACGCMTGLAVIILTSTQIVMAINGGLPQNAAMSIPGLLAGLIGMAAGATALNQGRKQGMFDTPTAAPIPPEQIPEGSVTCPYCNKRGISPHAQSCPSCGQPLT